MDGKACLAGADFSLKVRDAYAFDLDETVWLHLDLRGASANHQMMVSYDGITGNIHKSIQLAKNAKHEWQALSIPLEHARFANLGPLRSDLILYSLNEQGEKPVEFTICNLSLERTYRTPTKTFGLAEIEIVNETGHRVPARMGIYDSFGHMPLPSEDAVTVQYLGGPARVVPLGDASMWPVTNRSVFYTSGRYRTRLPAGDYQLIVARGPEYRLTRERFTIDADQTRAIRIKLKRWTDMAAKAWYSGEDHIHHPRGSAADDFALAMFAQAEDLRVANVVQMGNIARTYFHQRDWHPQFVDEAANYVLVPGQEDPRTTHRGHTLQLNIREPVRDPARYLLYHELFEKVREQGGITGYAHVFDPFNADASMKGMAIDVPFGIVDFAEIMTGHVSGYSIWFDFLNLGYKLAPSAGSDYPWVDIPGAVRNYVKIDGKFTPQAWFDELKKGHVFVTSGPMLEFSINGQGIGSEIHVSKGQALHITGKASLDSTTDELASLELIEQSDVVKNVSPKRGQMEVAIHDDLSAVHGTWYVLRAHGKNPNVTAVSAPIYVAVDGESFWKPSEVPSIVAKLKEKMQEVLVKPRQPDTTEPWDTSEVFDKHWEAQQCLLRERIEQADAIYDELVKRAGRSESGENQLRRNHATISQCPKASIERPEPTVQ